MPIICQICGREFSTQITNSHLKTHSITTAEYAKAYGRESLSDINYRNKLSTQRIGKSNPNFGNTMAPTTKKIISDKKKGHPPWNKGTKLDDTTSYIESAIKREQKYLSGGLTRKSVKHTDATKQKIAKGVASYAKDNHAELSLRAKTAIETKKNSGTDLAFFRGRKHSDQTKKLIAEKSLLSNSGRTTSSRVIYDEFITRANLTRVGEYDGNTVSLRCNKCDHKFVHTTQMFTPSKFTADRCPICYPNNIQQSAAELEIYAFVQSLCHDAVSTFKYSSGKSTVDIYIPSKSISIEYNGLYWHSEQVLENKTKDNDKHNALIELGIRPIVIFEDEWLLHKDLVKSRLKNILHTTSTKLFARKCKVQEISSKEASAFCKKYHIQGTGRSNVRIGLFSSDVLVSVMTFSKSNLSRKISGWELNRFCSVIDTTIVGGASKMFQFFVSQHKPKTIVSYADRRWSMGGVYSALGFDLHSTTSPGYWYFLPNELIRKHRFALRKGPSDIQNLSEYENRKLQGYNRVWDCGNTKWIWTQK